MNTEAPAQAQAQGRYEPSLTVTLLPRCPNPDCPDPIHPLAREERTTHPSVCPGCGGPAAEPRTQDAETVASFMGDEA